MSLQSTIDQRLWQAIQQRYEDGDFSGSISDAFYFLSDLIREKSGMESDGSALIGSAFGGDNPIIRVNALQTESDRSEQKGIEQILRGIYLGLRNPRSHEKREDTAKAADAVISFIDFLVGLIDKSKSPFDIEQILEKAFDKHFVPTKAYADALVTRIPPRKRNDVLAEAFNRRVTGKSENVRLFIESLLEVVSVESQDAFWKTISDTLEAAVTDPEIRSAVSICGNNWGKLTDIARLRIENMLISSINEGEFDPVKNVCSKGSLGTWTIRISDHFLTANQPLNTLSSRLGSDNPNAVSYVVKYFSDVIFDREKPINSVLAFRLRKLLDADNKAVYEALWFVNTEHAEKSWTERLGESMKKFSERNPETDEDIPF